MKTVIYLGNFDTQKGVRISFSEAVKLSLGAVRANRLTVDETVTLRRELGEGAVWKTANGNQIWMEEK